MDIMINAISHGLTWMKSCNATTWRHHKADIMHVANKYFGNEYLKAVKNSASILRIMVSQPGYKTNNAEEWDRNRNMPKNWQRCRSKPMEYGSLTRT